VSVTLALPGERGVAPVYQSDDPGAIPCEREHGLNDGSECSGRGSVLEL
jgi:hypothetical protein